MTRVRRVIGPGGSMVNMTFPEKSKSVEEPTVKTPEQNLDPNTESDTVEKSLLHKLAESSDLEDHEVEEVLELPEALKKSLTVEIIRSMEPQELKVVAEEKKLKIGNVKDKVKMQDKIIKLLELEEDVL